jgi:hypothetical protein
MAENSFASLLRCIMRKMCNFLLTAVFLTSAIGMGSGKGQTTKPSTGDEPDKAKSAPAGSREKKETKKKGRGKFTISKETTYVTGPVDDDGYIDYVAALNERLKEGVTPENNANVLIWKALGPHPERANMPPEFFKWLGIQVPPNAGDYFVDLDGFVKEHLKLDLNSKEAEQFYKRFDRAVRRPWSPMEYSDLAAWLEANAKPLGVVIEATKRPQYFSPLVPPEKGKKGSSGLITALLPAVQRCRGLANALVVRAMLETSKGKYDDAWQDLLACHRLGRLVGRGGTLVEALVGIAIDGLACSGDLAFLQTVKDDPKRIESCMLDLQNLPRSPEIADKVNLAERFVMLEIIMMVDRHGIKCLEALDGHAKDNPIGDFLGELVLKDMDWDPALKNANQWYDRIVAADRQTDRTARERGWAQIEADLKERKANVLEGKEIAEALAEGKDKGKAISKAIGDIMICLMTPAVHKVTYAADRIKQTHANLQLAFALAWYHCDHGHYPKSLDALAPKYLVKVPQDMFSGKALVYRPTDKGYLLYSVGVNGKDDGGRGYDDEPAGDDLVIRMPLPEWKAK